MNNLENLFQQYLYVSKNVLSEIFSDLLLERIILSIIKEFDIVLNSPLTKEVEPKDINQQMHVVTACFIIALSRALKIEISPDVSIEDIKEISMKIFRELVGPLADMQKNELSMAEDRWKTFKESTIYGTSTTYSSFNPKFINDNEKVLEFHLNKCIFYEIFKVHDKLALAPILCFYDDIFAEAVEEWIDFKKPKTIADGEDFCQFCYIFKES
ncbi:MAG: L-2-amino-thiazoline-4-carboxylic acid hydrolase [Promethearchaeota archaeon]|jgi:hypothetical protein